MDEQEILIKLFPLLIASCNFTKYEGFINVEGNHLQISIHAPNYPSLSNLSFRCSWSTGVLLTDHSSLIKEWIQNETLSSFLKKVQKFLTQQMKSKGDFHNFAEDCITAKSFKLLMSDLKKIDFCNVISVSLSLTKVQLKFTDSVNRTHIIDVKVGKTYPLEPIEVETMLPESALEIIRKNTSLELIYKCFVQQICQLQNTWNTLDIIDSHCCVLDPEHPTRKDMGRRIMIDKNVSIYLDFSIENEAAMPNITVLGPEQDVQHFNSNLARNKELWSSSAPILENLKLVLELASLPGKSKDEVSLVQQGECLICFTLWLDGEVPSVICEHLLCGSSFHSSCLFQWLQTVPGNYLSLNCMYGVCPNCGEPISCPVPKLN